MFRSVFGAASLAALAASFPVIRSTAAATPVHIRTAATGYPRPPQQRDNETRQQRRSRERAEAKFNERLPGNVGSRVSLERKRAARAKAESV